MSSDVSIVPAIHGDARTLIQRAAAEICEVEKCAARPVESDNEGFLNATDIRRRDRHARNRPWASSGYEDIGEAASNAGASKGNCQTLAVDSSQ